MKKLIVTSIVTLGTVGTLSGAFAASNSSTTTFKKIKKTLSGSYYGELGLSKSRKKKVYEDMSLYNLVQLKSKISGKYTLALRNEITVDKTAGKADQSTFDSVALQLGKSGVLTQKRNGLDIGTSIRFKQYVNKRSDNRTSYVMGGISFARKLTNTISVSGLIRGYFYLLKDTVADKENRRLLYIPIGISKSIGDKLEIGSTLEYLNYGVGSNNKKAGGQNFQLSFNGGLQATKSLNVGAVAYLSKVIDLSAPNKIVNNPQQNASFALTASMSL